MQHGRLPWYTPSELDADQQKFYQRLLAGPRGASAVTDPEGRLYGPFNARLLDPELGTALQELSAQLRFGTKLDGRSREIVILEVARAERCNFEWGGHTRAARATGLTAHEIEAVRSGAEAATLSPVEAGARRVAQRLLDRGDLSDDEFAEAEATLGLPRLFDVISLVGHYLHTALALRVWRVPNRPGDESAFWS